MSERPPSKTSEEYLSDFRDRCARNDIKIVCEASGCAVIDDGTSVSIVTLPKGNTTIEMDGLVSPAYGCNNGLDSSRMRRERAHDPWRKQKPRMTPQQNEEYLKNKIEIFRGRAVSPQRRAPRTCQDYLYFLLA